MTATGSKKSEQCILSIRLSTDGFSFFVYDPAEEAAPECVDYAVDESLSLAANLRQAFRDMGWQGLPFRRINVLVAGKRFTFLPLEFFDESTAGMVFHHNHPEQEGEIVLCNVLRGCGLAVLFGMDRTVCDFLREQYTDVHFYAQATPLIRHFSERSRTAGGNRQLYAHLRKTAVDVFAFEDGKLLLGNSLPCTVTADRIYYLLYLWKTLEFDQKQDELHLAGFVEDEEALLSELRKFIQKVSVADAARHLDLQSIIPCE